MKKLIDYVTNQVLDSMEARDKRRLQAQCEAAARHFAAKDRARLDTEALAEGA